MFVGAAVASSPAFTGRSSRQTDHTEIYYTRSKYSFSVTTRFIFRVIASAVDATMDAASTAIGSKGFAKMFPGAVKPNGQVVLC